MFKVAELSKHSKEKKILNNLSFTLDHGQIGIFLGGSGSGKSTLLRILNNLETCNSGLFSLDDVKLHLNAVNSSHTTGLVFQHFNLFEYLSVQENIVLTLTCCKAMTKKEATFEALKLLDQYELRDHSDKLALHLSGGQKQRLAIARTLAINPKIVCFDEPTSALDPRLTFQVAECIQKLASENKIILVTTHDMNLVQHLNGTLFFLEEGRIVETASKTEYASNANKYPKLQKFMM